tara:strand:- start:494 stop:964 length:471 start_codon:yes stop_codon:yes gene_type:complete
MAKCKMFRTRLSFYKFIEKETNGFKAFPSMRAFCKFGLVDKDGNSHRLYRLKDFIEKVNADFGGNYDADRSYSKGQSFMLFYKDEDTKTTTPTKDTIVSTKVETTPSEVEDVMEDNKENRKKLQEFAKKHGIQLKLSQKLNTMLETLEERGVKYAD